MSAPNPHLTEAACKVTLFHVPKVRVGNATRFATCGQPVVKYDLCAHHYADRVRLGGDA